MVEITVQDTAIQLGTDTISFDVPIAQHIIFEGFVVIRLKVSGIDHPNRRRNVIAIDDTGTTLWKVPELPEHDPRPYTRIYTKDGDDLWAFNSSGNLYQIDRESGEVLEREFVK